MSNSTPQDRRTSQEVTRPNLTSLLSSRTLMCEVHRPKKRRALRSAIVVWPLVVVSLIQVTSNLVSHHKQMPLSSSISHSPNEQSLNERVYEVGEDGYSAPSTTHCNSNFESLQDTLALHTSLRRRLREMSNSDYGSPDQCSLSRGRIPLPRSLLSSLLTYITFDGVETARKVYTSLSQITSTTIFGPKMILADAAQVTSKSMYQANHDKEIIVLNSTNFNDELMQYNHPFPHIKLIEYYLDYCGICLRFKLTYVQLSKEIYAWRNVIRSSAIDLGVSSNTLIANSWSINVIPTLRIHPPLSRPLSAKLNKQLSALSSKLSESDKLKSFSDSYNDANLTIGVLGVSKYTYDAKIENLADKVSLLKLELIRYIERYVQSNSDDLPSTWPNLRPVKEETLLELRRNHPRQELFLLIEAGGQPESTGTSGIDPTPSSQPSLGLRIMLELSSSAPFKAIRYVRANNNRALIKDVIAHKRKELGDQVGDGQQNQDLNVSMSEQVQLLQRLLDGKSKDSQDHLVLIQIDDSRSPYEHAASAPTNKFPFITVITESDLISADQQYSSLDFSGSNVNTRAKRAAITHHDHQRARRSLSNEENHATMNLQRNLELITRYINRTYIGVQEDREFVRALSSFDERPTSPNSKQDSIAKFQAIQEENQRSLSQNIRKSKQQQLKDKDGGNSTIIQFLSRLSPTSSNSFLSTVTRGHQDIQEDDYQDKLKAIRYIFFQEVPRKTLAEKSPAEKLKKLNTLINLASVIRAYFPLPDLASVQFIEGILNYLTKQQTMLSVSSNDQENRAPTLNNTNFDIKALKQVIKNLEADGKRLPEVKDWQLCRFSGYPCALWRLFHTLTAFEYKKLNQISLQSNSASRQAMKKQQNLTTVPTADNQVPLSNEQRQAQPVVPVQMAQTNNNGLPVERLVSPPSTTTSLALTIATPINSQDHQHASNDKHNNRKQVTEEDLPEPVLLVMRDYVTNFFSCEECARNFQQESMELTFDRVRRHEESEFSILWLWEAHNRVSKRLSINPETNPPEHPKKWYPSFEQCSKCYNKPPSYLRDTNVELAAIFHESIDWNREETLSFLVKEFTRQPMDMGSNLFGYSVPYGFNYIIVIGISSLVLIILLRFASCYIERQRRHKASLLNGNGAHYSLELQGR